MHNLKNIFSSSPLDILNATSDSIAIIDEDSNIIFVNTAWESFSDKNNGEKETNSIGSNYLNSCDVNSKDAKKAAAGIRKVINKGAREFEMEYPCHSENEQRWFSMRCVQLREQPKLYQISHRDISQQKNAEIELSKYNQLLEESQAVAQVGGWELDLETGYLYWTDETYRIHDTSPEEFNPTVDAGVGYFLPKSRDIITKAIDRAINEGIGYDLYLETYTTKGRKIDVRTTCKVTMKNGKSSKLRGIFQDITESKIREHKLLQSLKEVSDYKYALSQSSIVAITDVRGTITYVNNNFVAISQYSRKELVGQNHRVINSDHHPKKFWVDMWKTISSGNVWRKEIKNKAKDGTYYWVDTFIIPFKDDEGVIQQYISLRYEITQKKEKEEKISFQNLALKKANDELDNFVYRVSHDLRAPITSALGIIELCLMSEPSTEIQYLLDKLLFSMNKLDKFIQDILNYSRNSRLEAQKNRVDFEPFIREIISHNKPQGTDVDIRVSIKGTVPLITDETRLTIIFNNLLSNAFKFIATYKTDSFIEIDAQIMEKKVIIHISDNGIGIQEEHLENIFNMFYRATDTNYGSGLGLYIVKEAVQKIGGGITVNSQYGEGTTFTLTFPNHKEIQED